MMRNLDEMMKDQDKRQGTKGKAWNHVFSRYLRCNAKVRRLTDQIEGRLPFDTFISKELHEKMLSTERENLKMYDYMLRIIDMDQ